MRRAVVIFAAAAALAAAFEGGGHAAAPSRAEQYACYPSQFSAFRARSITIADFLGKLTAIVRRPLDVCAPAADATGYLTCYELSARAPVVAQTLGRVTNVFGAARLKIAAPRALCVSSSRTAKPPAATRLTCYAVVEPADDERTDVLVTDAFGASRDSVAVGAPISFCTEPKRDSLHLVCYAVESETAARTLVLASEWGFLRASPGLRDRLCVQSSLAS